MKYGKKTTALVSAAALAALAGCSTGGNGEAGNEKTTLKIMYYDEQSFYQQYGTLFSALHPEVEIQIVSTGNIKYEEGKDMKKAMDEFLAQEKPDVYMIGPDEYARMAEEGKLYNLDAFIKKDKFDLEGIAPGILEFIKQKSNGILYGLAPNFYSQALYYNKDLFSKHGVDLPEDRMSWEKVLQLAARFPTTGGKDDRVYGLKAGYLSNLYYFGNSIGSSMGLSYVNPSTKQLMINSESWKSVYGMADKALKSGTVYIEEQGGFSSSSYEDYLLMDPFIAGKVAMALDGNYLMDQIKEKNARIKEKGIQNWDVVTVPVNPQSPEESTAMSVNQIFAIDANSANAKAAWKFVSYINGDEFARVTSKLRNGGFPSRTKYMSSTEGVRMEAFYSLKPRTNDMYKDFDKIPQGFFMKFDGLTQQEFQGVTDGKVSVSEALDNLQAKGQKLMDEEVKNAGKGGESGAAGGGSTVVSGGSAIAVPAQ